MSIQITADTIATKAASAAQWGGSASAVVSGTARIFGLTADEWSVIGVMVGMAVAIGGFLLSWFYKQQHLKLARDLKFPDGD